MIGILGLSAGALVKEGSLDALWNHEYSDAADVTVAS